MKNLFFPAGEGTSLAVRPVRGDFPDTLHQNGIPVEEGHELCLYDVPWASVERRYSPSQVLSRILTWLRETAEGTLHQDEQALEQLFYDSGVRLVVPHDFREAMLNPATRVQLAIAVESASRLVLRASTQGVPPGRALDRNYRVLILPTDPVEHAPIMRPAYSLGELHDALSKRAVDFKSRLSSAVEDAARAEPQGLPDDDSWTIVVVATPRLRNDSVERVDLVCQLVRASAARIGVALGALAQTADGGPAAPFVMLAGARQAGSADWRSIGCIPVGLSFETSRAQARVYSGVPDSGAEASIVIAGAGALGSSVAHLWAREAWGRLTLIDEDRVEPHNTVRHSAYHADLLRPKVEVVTAQIDSALAEPAQSRAIVGDAAALESSHIHQALAGASLLVDASTSSEVPRRWSGADELPRAASIFLTPSGQGFALLLEDSSRAVRLIDLEAQYYGLLLDHPLGPSMLQANNVRRTGAGCRDKSVVISPEQIAVAAGVLARRVRLHSQDEGAWTEAWQTDDATGRIDYLSRAVASVLRLTVHDWTIVLDSSVLQRMRAMRAEHLPNETGGILLGMIDHAERSIHIVAAMPPPSDSLESPSGFVRGKEGVAACRARAQAVTAGMVDYVGDWHSHPPNYPATPSGTDAVLLARIAEQTAHDGTPAVMLIVNEDDFSISIGDASGALWR